MRLIYNHGEHKLIDAGQSYDYTLEKVKIYTRIPLGDIVGISKGAGFHPSATLPGSRGIGTGAYILSPLEEASRDPVQNAGFVVSWLNTRQVTRVTSYCVRNSPETPSSQPASPVEATPSPTITRNRLSTLPRKGTALSKLLSTASLAVGSNQSFAAFKVLPIDPARNRRANGGSTFTEPADELTGASNCKEAVDLIIESIRGACEDVGGAHGQFVTEADVVG